LSDLLNKTKTQPTKFFNELNRYQNLLSKKKNSRSDLKIKSTYKRKKKKGIPTLREMMDSNFRVSDKNVSAIPVEKDQESPDEKKVRFESPKRREQKQKERKISL
jgi:hypothetical protein